MNKNPVHIVKHLLLALSLLGTVQLHASIDLNYESVALEYILSDFGNKTALAFSYSSNTLALNKKYTIVGQVDNREEGVALICKRANLQFKFLGNMVILKQQPKVQPKPKQKKPESVQVNEVEGSEESEKEQMEYILPDGWEPAYQGPEFPDFKYPEAMENPPSSESLRDADESGLRWINQEADYSGHQAAVFWNKNYEDHSGREVALLFNKTKGRVKGNQVALFGNVAAGGYGNQVSLLSNLSTKSHKGNQVSLLCNIAGPDSGLRVQTAIFYNKNKGDTHAQVGSLNVNGRDSEGQYGFLNINGNDSGKQFGLFNINKGKVSRQYGLLNVADTCDYRSIGLINFIRKGYNRFEIAYSSEFELNASFRFGHERLYTILGTSIDWSYDKEYFWERDDWYFNRGALSLGFGGYLYSKGRFSFMQELIGSRFIIAGRGFDPEALMLDYGLSSGFRLGRKGYNSTLILGIHLNVLKQNEHKGINIDNLDFIDRGRLQLFGSNFDFWPGVKLGFRF